MRDMTIDALPRGRNQPFYNVFSDDGSKRCKYDFITCLPKYAYHLVPSFQDVAEENILPTAFTRKHVQTVFRKFDEFSVYFDGGVDLPSESNKDVCCVSARGRLHMSPQARYAYPDDETVALRWLEQGVFPV